MKALPDWLQDTFGHPAKDLALFEAALTHRSAASRHNERLEFLGDAVLNCITASMLYHAFPAAPEGELSRYRATLVSGESLAAIAAELDLGDRLRLGAGELKSGGFRRKSTLADALEAVLGAIYLDGGFDAAANAIGRIFAPRIPLLPSAAQLKDAKTRLQEALQSRAVALPEYQVLNVTGEPHAQHFTVGCEVPSLGLAARGEGNSRRVAEQASAEQVFTQLQQLWGLV